MLAHAVEVDGSDERALLRRLCVFAGRFTLEDVESVCTSQDVPVPRALDLLSSLVDKSLVTKEDAKRGAKQEQSDLTPPVEPPAA